MFKVITNGLVILAITLGFLSACTAKTPPKINIEEGFQLSKAEKKEIKALLSKIKTSDTFELYNAIEAAHEGNPVAMWIVGQCSLSGNGTSINRQAATTQFKMAATLGYAPALIEISQMYASENKDPLLSLVYLNLTISFGHKEYSDLYCQKTELMSKIIGKSIIREIENIALKKIISISKFKEDLEGRKNTYKPALSLIFKNITSEDVFYDKDYWKQYFESQEAWERYYGM